jgi:pSer/pThr/pTyr-binding forkhead associated (FHA) protein
MTGAKIVYCGRDGLKHIYDISTKETTLGRRDDNQIFLPDELTSKYHAIVLTTSEGIFLKDKNSANGVKLNDKSIVVLVVYNT